LILFWEILKTNDLTKGEDMYRIHTIDRKIKFAGTDFTSWFKTLEEAKIYADDKSGDMIYEYDSLCRPLWEVL